MRKINCDEYATFSDESLEDHLEELYTQLNNNEAESSILKHNIRNIEYIKKVRETGIANC
jgi:hypothetical protein